MRLLLLATIFLFSGTASATVFFEEYKCEDKDEIVNVRMIYSVGLGINRITLFASADGPLRDKDLIDVRTLRSVGNPAPEGKMAYGALENETDKSMTVILPITFGSSSFKRPKKFTTYAYGTDLECRRK